VTQASYKATQAMPTPPLVGGRRLLTTIAASAGAGAGAGAITWFALHGLMPSANAALITQLVIAVLYATLLASFVVSFSPLQNPPLDLRFTSAKDLLLACLALLGIVCSSLLVYLLLSPLTCGLAAAARQILSLVTDAARLKGQPPSAWVVAIARGCLIVPLFEEMFFRSLLFGWLRKRLSTRSAIGGLGSAFCRDAWLSDRYAVRILVRSLYRLDSRANGLHLQYGRDACPQQRALSLCRSLSLEVTTVSCLPL
jgi:membrane protease YdiL (CAAX protease family)